MLNSTYIYTVVSYTATESSLLFIVANSEEEVCLLAEQEGLTSYVIEDCHACNPQTVVDGCPQ